MQITTDHARRFLLHAHSLTAYQSLPDVETAIHDLEFVQEDSINVCGRIHDLILRNRVRNYTPQHLATYLYDAPRGGFEHYFPNLSAIPLADFPYFVRRLRKRAATPGRWHGLEPGEHEIAERLLTQMETEGVLRTRATGNADGHTLSGWGTRTTIAARVIEKLWLHGRLMISHRVNFERYFHHTAHLSPEIHKWLTAPETDLPTEAQELAHLTRKRLRARRLFRLKRTDATLLGKDAFTTVTLPHDPKPWHLLTEDLPLFQASETLPLTHTTLLLAPLDPLIYDRERNRVLFDFDYIWEVYTPQAKRQWGYYVLPILQGTEIVARVDPKFDRKTNTLQIQALHLTPTADKPALETALATFEQFLKTTP